MDIAISNILGIERAELRLTPGAVTEVVGPNASGKTSIAVAVQALATQTANPLGLPVAETRKTYLHNGDSDGRATLLDGSVEIIWRPHNQSISAPPDVMLSNIAAAGLVDFTGRRGESERREVFQSVLLPDPESIIKEVEHALEQWLQPDDLRGVVKVVRERGWKAAEEVYADRGRQAKGEWRQITGRNYGVKVAADWRPEGWQADYDHLTVQGAEAAVTDARDALDALHRTQAVTQAEADAAEEARGRLPALREQVDSLRRELDQVEGEIASHAFSLAQRELNDAQIALTKAQNAVGAAQNEKHLECPQCTALVMLKGDALVMLDGAARAERMAELLDAEDVAQAGCVKQQERMDGILAVINPLSDRREALGNDLRAYEVQLKATEMAAGKSGPVITEEHRQALAEAEATIDDAKVIVDLVSREKRASDLRDTIARYTAITDALGPKGIRSRMMGDGARKLNAGLRVLAKESGWPLVEVSEEGQVQLGGRPVQVCSESERWRAQACIQLTLGAMTGARIVVLDRADLLDEGNRHGMVNALSRAMAKRNMAVLVCSTGEGDGTIRNQIRVSGGKTE